MIKLYKKLLLSAKIQYEKYFRILTYRIHLNDDEIVYQILFQIKVYREGSTWLRIHGLKGSDWKKTLRTEYEMSFRWWIYTNCMLPNTINKVQSLVRAPSKKSMNWKKLSYFKYTPFSWTVTRNYKFYHVFQVLVRHDILRLKLLYFHSFFLCLEFLNLTELYDSDFHLSCKMLSYWSAFI